jgi:hypothetical protein
MPEVAARAGVSAETQRKIETGRAPPPAGCPLGARACALGRCMDELIGRCAQEAGIGTEAAA